MDKFNDAYLKVIKQWHDDAEADYWREQQAYKNRLYNKYIHTDFRDPQETDPVQEYQEWMGDHVGDYLNDDSKAQEINDQLDYNFSQEQWDALSPEEKTKEVIKIIIDKSGCEPYEIMDIYHLDWEEAVGLDNESFKGWCDDLKTCYNGEFDFFKPKTEQTNQQIEECDGAAPCAGGPVGAPPPPPGGCDLGGMGPAGTPPIGHVPPPPPPPPRRAGIHTRNVGALYVPTAPIGWWSRFKNTSTKKKRKKVRRKKKK